MKMMRTRTAAAPPAMSGIGRPSLLLLLAPLPVVPETAAGEGDGRAAGPAGNAVSWTAADVAVVTIAATAEAQLLVMAAAEQ